MTEWHNVSLTGLKPFEYRNSVPHERRDKSREKSYKDGRGEGFLPRLSTVNKPPLMFDLKFYCLNLHDTQIQSNPS